MSGSQLRKLRLGLKLTQAELGKQLGVASNTVARWERNERRIPEPAARLVMLLGQSLSMRKGRR